MALPPLLQKAIARVSRLTLVMLIGGAVSVVVVAWIVWSYIGAVRALDLEATRWVDKENSIQRMHEESHACKSLEARQLLKEQGHKQELTMCDNADTWFRRPLEDRRVARYDELWTQRFGDTQLRITGIISIGVFSLFIAAIVRAYRDNRAATERDMTTDRMPHYATFEDIRRAADAFQQQVVDNIGPVLRQRRHLTSINRDAGEDLLDRATAATGN